MQVCNTGFLVSLCNWSWGLGCLNTHIIIGPVHSMRHASCVANVSRHQIILAMLYTLAYRQEIVVVVIVETPRLGGHL